MIKYTVAQGLWEHPVYVYYRNQVFPTPNNLLVQIYQHYMTVNL